MKGYWRNSKEVNVKLNLLCGIEMKRARILYHSFGIVERNCKFEGVKESSNTVSQDAITKCSVSVILTSTASVTLTSVFDMCPFGS